jgi:hypothetical protein
MAHYTLYRDDLEEVESDEQETHKKIVEVMTEGMHLVRKESGSPENVRISHAKAFGLLKGELIVKSGLPPELAQGLFAQPGTHPVLVRLATAPGEINDDSKVKTVRGMAIKVFNVSGPKLPGHTADTQDFVLDTGKEFFNSGVKAFLQTFKPNATIAPRLSDDVKGAISGVSRATNAALNAVGLNSEKLDFFGHEVKHPMAEEYYSQTPFRYGDYVAKIGVVPDTPGLKALFDKPYDPKTPDAFREATNGFFRTQDAEFLIVVQLNVDPALMPIEDAQAKWPEELSQYVPVARLMLPVQTAFDSAKNSFFEDLSFSPGHSLAAHRPLGAINRARLVAYRALAERRLTENHKPTVEITSASQIPA